MPTDQGQNSGYPYLGVENVGNFDEYLPRRGRGLCRKKSISSSVLPTISIMVEGTSSSSMDGRGGRRESMSSHMLNHAYTCNSIAESQHSYHSHPNLNSDLLEGTMYTQPEKVFNENYLHDGYGDPQSNTPTSANHIRSSFLALFTKRR